MVSPVPSALIRFLHTVSCTQCRTHIAHICITITLLFIAWALCRPLPPLTFLYHKLCSMQPRFSLCWTLNKRRWRLLSALNLKQQPMSEDSHAHNYNPIQKCSCINIAHCSSANAKSAYSSGACTNSVSTFQDQQKCPKHSSCSRNMHARKHSAFLLAAVHIHFHVQAPSRKAKITSTTLLLMRAVKHIKGRPGKRRAVRAALRTIMKASISAPYSSPIPLTPPSTNHDPSFKKITSRKGGGEPLANVFQISALRQIFRESQVPHTVSWREGYA